VTRRQRKKEAVRAAVEARITGRKCTHPVRFGRIVEAIKRMFYSAIYADLAGNPLLSRGNIAICYAGIGGRA